MPFVKVTFLSKISLWYKVAARLQLQPSSHTPTPRCNHHLRSLTNCSNFFHQHTKASWSVSNELRSQNPADLLYESAGLHRWCGRNGHLCHELSQESCLSILLVRNRYLKLSSFLTGLPYLSLLLLVNTNFTVKPQTLKWSDWLFTEHNCLSVTEPRSFALHMSWLISGGSTQDLSEGGMTSQSGL